jgi:hypothetical protein
MSDPKNITEATTLGELREQRLLLGVIAIRIYPSLDDAVEASSRQEALEGVLEASVHHATGFFVGRGRTEAAAIEAAFSKLRRAILPEPLKQYLHEIENK